MKLKNALLTTTLIIILNCSTFCQEQYELASIKFSGNNSISSSTLGGIIYSEETPWWFWKFLNSFTSFGAEPVYFDSGNINIDLRSLEEYYNASGFFNTSFGYEYAVDTADKEVFLTYLVNEGTRSRYGNFYLYGTDSLPPPHGENFAAEVYEDSTDYYDQSLVQSNIAEGLSYLQNNGYMLAHFDSTIVYRDTSGNKADLHIYFSPGERYKIDTVYVEKNGPGAPFISEKLLRELTAINSGEYYSLEKIRLSRIRLFRTGLFNSINLAGAEQDTSDSVVPLRLQGSIGNLNELSPEIIVNNQQSAFNIGLGASYVRKNFLGDARKLTLRTSFGVQDILNANFSDLFSKLSLRDTTLLGYVDARATIEQPYLFNRPIFGIWETYATVNKQAAYNNTLYGSKITFQFELPRFTAINMLSTYYNIENSKELYRVRNDSLSNKLISVLGTDFGRTTVDDILFPTSGYIISFQLEEANSIPYFLSKIFSYKFNEALFYRIIFNSSIYFALDARRNQIFAAKFKTGHLQAYRGDYGGIPINRTFYSGGSNSNRGWRSNQLVPEDAPVINEKTDLGVNVKGGTFIIEGSMEFRQRLFENFGIALFSDYSNTWLNYKDARIDEIALAAGLGLRYYTSVAPFRIDFGFKLYNPSDKEFIFRKKFWSNVEFHFGIGEAF